MEIQPEIIYYTCKYQCEFDSFNGVHKHARAPESIRHVAELLTDSFLKKKRKKAECNLIRRRKTELRDTAESSGPWHMGNRRGGGGVGWAIIFPLDMNRLYTLSSNVIANLFQNAGEVRLSTFTSKRWNTSLPVSHPTSITLVALPRLVNHSRNWMPIVSASAPESINH